ncbi:MAG: SCP-2 sterol transfer family protein [endosymbiont of Galathealinum brachiosum]|uniref:SCP-2 sterol transfer family protein n=1 Tax=endosymbiont of Galathealinum brachiosum TaxID=2200906 RepID=A0A370DKF8_9GAMM|nr:MAG: SCP-2 sterol transfer family protein [endosymbiont of Galathealinum brachiosum]
MPELFTNDWATNYKELWNSNDGIAKELGQSNFNSVVAFGIEGEDDPRVVLTISNGQIITAGTPNGELINWDLRASNENWMALVAKPPGLMKLGLAYTSRKLKFKKGDYAVMIKDPRLSTAFVKCFALMGKAVN